jgi:hypothetical protein
MKRKKFKEATNGMALSFPTCDGHSLCDAHCRQGARVKNSSKMRQRCVILQPACVYASCSLHSDSLRQAVRLGRERGEGELADYRVWINFLLITLSP